MRECGSCVPGQGRSIWNDQPIICSSTSCVWLLNPQILDSFRPDKCKVKSELLICLLHYLRLKVYWNLLMSLSLFPSFE